MKLWESWKILTIMVGLISSSTLSTVALATEGNSVLGSRYTSGRGAALGDAFLPLADDGASGLFYNPAAIGRLKEFRFEPMNLQGQLNSGLFGGLNENVYKVTDLSQYKGELKKTPNARVGGSFSYLPNVYFKGFAAGLLVQSRVTGKYNSPADTVDSTGLYYVVPAVGVGIPLARGIVRVGYSLQYVQKSVGTNSAKPYSGGMGYNDGIKEGTALSHTLGYALTLPFASLPAWNLVARNIGGARYTKTKLYPWAKNSTGAPDTEQMSIDTSLSIVPKLGKGTYFNLVLEGKDILNRSKVSILGRVAAGFEFVARELFFVRAGYGNGYPSMGIGLKTNKGELSITWFSEEIGGAYHAERDTRYMFHYQVRAF